MVREEDLRLVSARQAGRTPARIQLDYWTEFAEYLRRRKSFLNPPAPKAQRSMVFETTGGCRLAASLHLKDSQIWVDLTLGRGAKRYFECLEKDRDAIERQIGEELEWVSRSEGVESWILIRKSADPTDRTDWSSQHAWLSDKVERFSKAFRPRLMKFK